MLYLVWMCLIALVAGALAKLIMPGKDPGGMVVTVVTVVTMFAGLAGSLVAGLLGRRLGWYQEGQGAGLVMSVAGGILLSVVYRSLKRS